MMIITTNNTFGNVKCKTVNIALVKNSLKLERSLDYISSISIPNTSTPIGMTIYVFYVGFDIYSIKRLYE